MVDVINEGSAVSLSLEQAIDKHGLSNVLSAIADICVQKAEHIRENWQDDTTAKVWIKDAKTVEATANTVMSS